MKRNWEDVLEGAVCILAFLMGVALGLAVVVGAWRLALS